MRHSDSNYYFGPPLPLHEDDPRRVCEFLKLLSEESDFYYRPWPDAESDYIGLFGQHSTNYEDLYYLATQLEDTVTGEHENPAIEHFRKYLEREVQKKGLLHEGEGPTGGEWSFDRMVSEAKTYVECVVREKLDIKPPKEEWVDSLSLFRRAHQDGDVARIDVYTLNHDTLLEKFFQADNLAFTDGFDEQVNRVRYWRPELFEKSTPPTRLFKLHGSVDWFQFRSLRTTEAWSTTGVGIPLDGDHAHCRDRNGNSQMADPPRPLMLLGTFNKMLLYHHGIFADLQFRFFDNLRKADQLIVCGYGFGDKAVNARLLDWAWGSEAHRFVVIDPNPDTLKMAARGAFRKSWKSLEDSGRLTFIGKAIQDVSWIEVREAMH